MKLSQFVEGKNVLIYAGYQSDIGWTKEEYMDNNDDDEGTIVNGAFIGIDVYVVAYEVPDAELAFERSIGC